MSLVVWGLSLDIIGVLILTLVTIINYPHQRIFGEKEWWKRYWWMGWRPFYKNTKTLSWKVRLNRMVIVYGPIPPKHVWNIIGFLFILVGFLLQIMFYLA